jgi:hypothetical protein
MLQRHSGFPHNARDFHETLAWVKETFVSVIDVADLLSGSTTTAPRRSATSAPPNPEMRTAALADGPGGAQSKSSRNSSNQPIVQVNMIATAAEQVRP